MAGRCQKISPFLQQSLYFKPAIFILFYICKGFLSKGFLTLEGGESDAASFGQSGREVLRFRCDSRAGRLVLLVLVLQLGVSLWLSQACRYDIVTVMLPVGIEPMLEQIHDLDTAYRLLALPTFPSVRRV